MLLQSDESREDCMLTLCSRLLSCSVANCVVNCCLQNVQCPICTPVKEYVRRTRTQAGTPGGMGAPGAAQPTGSMNSQQLAGDDMMQSQQQQLSQQQQQMPPQQQHQQQLTMQQQMSLQQVQQLPVQQHQQQQQASSQMLGQKRPLNGMDPAAAAAMPAGSLPGMIPMGPSSTGGGMMGMMPQAMPQQQQQQYQQPPYGAAAAGSMQGMPQGMVPVANGGMGEHTSKRVKQEGGNSLLAKVGRCAGAGQHLGKHLPGKLQWLKVAGCCA